MRKSLLSLLLVSIAGLAFYRSTRDREDSRLAFDRFWIDHMPSGPKDKFQTAILVERSRAGMFESQTSWIGQWEAFRFSARDNGKLEIVYPATDARETVSVRARKCNESGFDYCLELTGSSRGVRRYYSKRAWDQSGTQNPLSELRESN